ncbi:hypothetical protein PTSG_07841 [Salpingoeca rosetta]|uniref:B30.2/SPRY domain-containing protein n=1 Tax=Salpingoeca rosetta (strain ATCC 50818 / BSB-021) TaxID=946362 RepID=F2UGH5_SALR5|nr:uncharacterized protein PTSG_07841 [Salpingoeca rosetta]EGD75725.1 hypothetical protein PTSG_07841 [Salpingoeca rosetta]|eukprot:XP_004991646.1 hypothetical protein PTSG_07841 [Salpingoeca rosetta]
MWSRFKQIFRRRRGREGSSQTDSTSTDQGPEDETSRFLKQCITQTVLDAPRAVTQDFYMEGLENVFLYVDRAEHGDEYERVAQALIEAIPHHNPMAKAVIALFVETLPTPPVASLKNVSGIITNTISQQRDEQSLVNALMCLALLADNFSGALAENLCSPELISRLETLLMMGERPLIVLKALTAVEMLARTGANKSALQEHGTPAIVFALEQRYQSGGVGGGDEGDGDGVGADGADGGNADNGDGGGDDKTHSGDCDGAREATRATSIDDDQQGMSTASPAPAVARTAATPVHSTGGRGLLNVLLKAQLAFCTSWLLDNVLPCSRRPIAVRAVPEGMNVMLDAHDATKFLKLSPDGVEIRSDVNSFESVRATCCATSGKCWYYEVTLFTAGIMQIGWAVDGCQYQTEEGRGIGDDEYSLAVDGSRQLVWFNQAPAHTNIKWRPGDVLGCYLDLVHHRAWFSVNGQRTRVLRLPPHLRDRVYPAASLMIDQHVAFNFGDRPYKFRPVDEDVYDLNQIGVLTEQQRRIIPRLVLLNQIQQELNDDDDLDEDNTCSICFVRPIEVVHEPCGHRAFCLICSLHTNDNAGIGGR